MISVGVVGLGRTGMLYLRNVSFIDGVSVEAVADKSEKELTNASYLGVNNVFFDSVDMIGYSSLDADFVDLADFLYERRP